MPQVIVVVPTLAADEALADCLHALAGQSWADFEVIIVDNSATKAVRGNPTLVAAAAACRATVLDAPHNLGYGSAINLAAQSRASAYVAALNDDAVPHRDWLASLVSALSANVSVGMGASSVRIAGTETMDSAGMLVYRDGSSKQRGHGRAVSAFARSEPVLLPSGSAALYRRAMLEEIGWFDEEFFLYCEDTDLGLRGRWAGWGCMYVAEAVVDHRYSHSAGRASRLKAYYVERNRLRVLAKNFPARMLVWAPVRTAARYVWHLITLLSGRGAAGEFRMQNANPLVLVWYIVRAHLQLLANIGSLARQRRAILSRARLSPAQFQQLLEQNSISAREVASQ